MDIQRMAHVGGRGSVMRAVGIALAVCFMFGTAAAPAPADGHGGILGKRSKTGSQLGVLDREEIKQLVAKYGTPSTKGPWWQFGTASVCGGQPGGGSSD